MSVPLTGVSITFEVGVVGGSLKPVLVSVQLIIKTKWGVIYNRIPAGFFESPALAARRLCSVIKYLTSS